jgi:serine/threonine protein kinase
MWALGVIIVELFLKKNKFFKCDDNEEKTIENQLKCIFSKLGIENIHQEEISNIIEDDDNYEKYKLKNEEIIKNIPDKDAIDLISHLLVINPKRRYSSKEVLNSQYLSYYKDEDPLDVKIQKNLIYDKLNDSFNDVNKFIEIIGDLKSIK